jgi:hypothetical protein
VIWLQVYIQWLVTLGSIVWNFKALTMEFTIAKENFLLQGLVAPNLWEEIKFLTSKLEGKKGLLIQLLENVRDSAKVFVDTKLVQILGDFADIFAEPTGLPHYRSHDHAIVLKSDVQPVYVQTYFYPYIQKEKIERIV